MTGHDQPGAVQLRRTASVDGDTHAFTAHLGDRVLADVTMVPDRGGLRLTVDLTPAIVPTASDLAAILAAAVAEARAAGVPALALAADGNLRLRYHARAAGFTGPLRSDLVLALRSPPSPDTPTSLSAQDRLMADLRMLLPGVEIKPARAPGVLRSLLRGASSGVVGTVHMTVFDPSDLDPLKISVPVAHDVMAEGVAMTIDTALSVRRRFRPLVDGVRIFHDHAIQGLRAGTVAGVAEATVRDIHLNPAYALLSEMELLERSIRERSPATDVRRRPTTSLPPFTRLDSVVAHEFWHQIEFGFETSRYGDSVAFRRAIGRYLGVETLEHAIKGGNANAPPAWQAARARLAEEVSTYATTAPKEATAELFAQWWCTPAAPPPPAQFFGSLLAQFFPPATP